MSSEKVPVASRFQGANSMRDAFSTTFYDTAIKARLVSVGRSNKSDPNCFSGSTDASKVGKYMRKEKRKSKRSEVENKVNEN